MTSLATPTGFAGDLITPDHGGYEEARSFFNRLIDRRPAAIAMCRSESDVQAAVHLARENELEIAVRSGGHSVPGHSVVEGGIVVDLSHLKGIDIDAPARRARIQPGLNAGAVEEALAPHGLVAVAGIEADPGFVGLAIHSGRGLLSRRHGWASDHIRSARVVTADGECIAASPETNTDLLYGLRGLGSSFGIVTELEVEVHPIPAEIRGGPLIYGPDQLGEVVPAVLAMFEGDISDNLDAFLTFFVDDGSTYLELLLLHIGESDEAERELARVDAIAEPLDDKTGRLSYAQFLAGIEHPPLDRFVWAEQGSDLSAPDRSDVLLQSARELPNSATPGLPNHYLISEPPGGDFVRDAAVTSPVPPRRSANIAFFGAWSDPSIDSEMWKWAVSSRDELERSGAGNGSPILTYQSITGPAAVRRAYGEEAYRRLQDLKRRYDPDNIFHLNHGADLPSHGA